MRLRYLGVTRRPAFVCLFRRGTLIHERRGLRAGHVAGIEHPTWCRVDNSVPVARELAVPHRQLEQSGQNQLGVEPHVSGSPRPGSCLPKGPRSATGGLAAIALANRLGQYGFHRLEVGYFRADVRGVRGSKTPRFGPHVIAISVCQLH